MRALSPSGRRAAVMWAVAACVVPPGIAAQAEVSPLAATPLDASQPGTESAASTGAASAERPFKFTAGYYDFGSFAGKDANLRHRREDTSLWLGWYEDAHFGEQFRVGWDTSVKPFAPLPLFVQPSLQAASHGFVGGSLNLQYGQSWFVLAGIGRTNLRPYMNLNFDPNDAITVSTGYQPEDGPQYAVTFVADDRLGTRQRHLHGTLHWPLPEGQRATFDVLRKTGQGDGGYVRAWGATLTYDFPRWFVRLAYDPKQNFGVYDVTRLSAGIRF